MYYSYEICVNFMGKYHLPAVNVPSMKCLLDVFRPTSADFYLLKIYFYFIGSQRKFKNTNFSVHAKQL